MYPIHFKLIEYKQCNFQTIRCSYWIFVLCFHQVVMDNQSFYAFKAGVTMALTKELQQLDQELEKILELKLLDLDPRVDLIFWVQTS